MITLNDTNCNTHYFLVAVFNTNHRPGQNGIEHAKSAWKELIQERWVDSLEQGFPIWGTQEVGKGDASFSGFMAVLCFQCFFELTLANFQNIFTNVNTNLPQKFSKPQCFRFSLIY
jgi:hypothetical protein